MFHTGRSWASGMDKGTPGYFMWSILAAVLMAGIGGMIYIMFPPGRVVGKDSLLLDVFYAGVWVSFVYLAAVVVAVFVMSPFNVKMYKTPRGLFYKGKTRVVYHFY